ncbi:hypothetical protein Daesc_007539 [Daldinia eschscholtzii]|uniref:Distal membrane-arm assembly complex protein 1-like domain-containing protein n=1 Tax=Daldinia eschscholtzii TaxID=292717 RepID=A0AAX6MED0_9PEZI
MSRDKVPTVGTLDKPEDLKELLKQDRGEDCLPCRVVGGGAFIGLAAYSYYSGQRELEKNSARILASKSIFGMRSRRSAAPRDPKTRNYTTLIQHDFVAGD